MSRPAPGPSRDARAWEHAVPGVVMALAALVPCWRVLLLRETFFFRDLALYFIPQRGLFGEILSEGRLPAWDPFRHGGVPLWASPNAAAAHPFTLLYGLLDAPLALGVETALCLLLGALGTWLLSRELGLGRWPAALAGTAFSLSGVMLSLVNLRPCLLALAPLPAMAWALERRLAGRRGGLLLPILAATCIVSGGAEPCLIAAVVLGAWAAVARSAMGRAARAAWLVACAVAALALAAPGWMPALDVIGGSARRAGIPWSEVLMWSVAPGRLAELAIPGLLGRTDALDVASYWGRALESEGFPFLVSISFGPVVVALAVLGALRPSALDARRRALLAVLALAAIALALGRHVPGAEALGEAGLRLPLRFPQKTLMLAVLPVALLAGAGLDSFRLAAARSHARAALALGLAGGALLVAASMPALWPRAAAAVLSAWLRVDPGPAMAGLPLPLASAALQALALAAACVLATRPGRAEAATILAACAGIAGLVAAAPRVNPTAPRDVLGLDAEPPAVAVIRDALRGGRLHRDDVPLPATLPATSDDIVHQVAWNVRALRSFMAAAHGIPVVVHDDYDALAPERIATLSRIGQRLPLRDRLPLLRSLGVTVVVTRDGTSLPGLRRLAPLQGAARADLAIHALEDAAPTARFVARARLVPDEAAAVRAVLDPSHDARREVVLVGTGDAPAAECAGRVEPGALSLAPPQELVVESACDGFVVLAAPYQPSLEVTVDGRPVPLFAADVASTAVRVTAGRHVVRWTCRVRHLGLATGLAALAAAGLALAAARRAPRRAPNDSRTPPDAPAPA